MPPIDLVASIQNIKIKLQHDFYKNEYQFQLDLFQTVGRGYDGHLYFWPDLLTGVIAFEKNRRLAIVSVSRDGIELPKIYLYGKCFSVCDFCVERDDIRVEFEAVSTCFRFWTIVHTWLRRNILIQG